MPARPRAQAFAILAVAALAALSGCIQINIGPPTETATHSHSPETAPAPGSGEFALDFSWTPENPSVRDTVTFQATVSNLGERTIDEWVWDWGDGKTGTGPRASHKWDQAVLDGYDVTLRVLASDGQHEVSHLVFVTG